MRAGTSGENRDRGLDQGLEVLHRTPQVPLRGSLHENPVEDPAEWSRRQHVIAVELDVGGQADPLEQVLDADLPAVAADALKLEERGRSKSAISAQPSIFRSRSFIVAVILVPTLSGGPRTSTTSTKLTFHSGNRLTSAASSNTRSIGASTCADIRIWAMTGTPLLTDS